MPAISCHACGRCIDLPSDELALPSITCARCNTDFCPAEQQRSAALPPIRRSAVDLVPDPAPEPSLAYTPNYSAPLPRWYHSPWRGLLVATASVCLGNLLATAMEWTYLRIRIGAESNKLE